MAKKVVLLDTSILIDFYRKTNKENTIWMYLLNEGYDFVISSITKYEIYNNIVQSQKDYWDTVLREIQILAFDENVVDVAIDIHKELKKKESRLKLPICSSLQLQFIINYLLQR